MQEEMVLHKKIAAGDEEAFAKVHEKLKTGLLFYACKLGLEWESAQEVVSDSFVSLWHSRTNIEDDEHIRKFLFVAVRNRTINYLKSKKRYAVLLQQADTSLVDDPSLQEDMIRAEMLSLLGKAIESLPKECRKVFELVYSGQYKATEIAKMLDMNAGTVRSQKRRAITLIKEWMASNSIISLVLLSCSMLAQNNLENFFEFFARLNYLSCCI